MQDTKHVPQLAELLLGLKIVPMDVFQIFCVPPPTDSDSDPMFYSDFPLGGALQRPSYYLNWLSLQLQVSPFSFSRDLEK